MKDTDVSRTALLRERFIQLLPQYRFNYTQAALAAGYSETYARTGIHGYVKKNKELCRRIQELAAINLQSNKDKVMTADKKCEFILDTCTLPDGQRVSPNVYHSFMVTFFRRHGALTATGIETDDQPKLSKEQREAAMKASIKLMQSQYKPGGKTG